MSKDCKSDDLQSFMFSAFSFKHTLTHLSHDLVEEFEPLGGAVIIVTDLLLSVTVVDMRPSL